VKRLSRLGLLLVPVLGAVASGCGGGGGGHSGAPFDSQSTAAGVTPTTTASSTGTTGTGTTSTGTTGTGTTSTGTGTTTGAGTTTTPAPGAPRFRVSGWQPYWANTSGDQTVSANVDEVNIFGYRLGADGTITPTTGCEDRARHAAIKNRGGELIPTVLDVDNAANMSAVLNSAAAKTRLVQQIVGKVTTFGYDGIDIDFEHVVTSTRASFNAVMAELGRELRSRGKLLSITVPGKRSDTSNWPGYDFAALGAAADRIKIMTYGYSGPWSRTPGPIAPLSWIRTCMDYAITCMPARKIQIGIPFYGYDWPNDATSTIRSVTWSSAQAKLALSTAGLQYDATRGEAYFDYTDASGLGHRVWLQDHRAIAAKCELVKQYGAGGLSIWSLGNEDPRFWDSIRRVLK
jgi:spore germination protein